jgi:energy-converting hydrogenase Eha subunit E
MKKVVLGIVVGIVLVIVGAVGASIATGVGDYILGSLNKTGFTIPSSANYLTPIGSLPSSVFLILMIVFIVIGVVVIIEALLKSFSGLSA